MARTSDPGRGLVRRLSLAAAAILVLSAAAGQRAEALSPINAGAVPAAKSISDGLTTEVRGGHSGGGGFRGGGGFHSGGAVFHGGGFRSGPAFHGGGFRSAHVFHSGGMRHGRFAFRHHHHRHFFYGPSYYDGPSYYYYPYRRCHTVWTYYGPRRICHYRHWRHHHRRHHYYW